jgi:hypothetical protein
MVFYCNPKDHKDIKEKHHPLLGRNSGRPGQSPGPANPQLFFSKPCLLANFMVILID